MKPLLKVFLVEDEVVIREGIRERIDWKANGFEFCGEAPNGEIAPKAKMGETQARLYVLFYCQPAKGKFFPTLSVTELVEAVVAT